MSLDQLLLDRAHALVEALEGAAVDRVASLDGVSTAGFLGSISALGELARAVDSFGALLSAQLTHRVQTDAEFRREVLGGDVGGRFASELFRDLSRAGDDTIRDWDRVGDAIAPRTTLQGEPLPCRHEVVSDAVLGASISARSAAVIARGIDLVADHADAATLHEVETTLVEYAGSLTDRQLARLVRGLPDRFDPDGAEPREEFLRQRSKVTLRQLPNGLTRLVADLHPEAGGLVRAAIDACTAPRRHVAFVDAADAADDADDADAGSHAGPDARRAASSAGHAASADEPVGVAVEAAFAAIAADADTRSLAEKRVDALTTIARGFLAADTGSLAGTAVTMLVTVPLETLQSGVGTATIAGVDEPICASTARRLAADAELIPVVLGRDSEVLDLGRSARLFSEAQRRALAARDGGCIWPGCEAPPGWCEVAHLSAWILGGPTDLDNGALMCAAHHRRFDHDGWQLRWEAGAPSLIPPPWIDPSCTPRRAGRMPAFA